MIIETIKLHPWQAQAIRSPYTHTFLYGGIGSGKSTCGAHFVIDQILSVPEVPGFIAANSYDQLSTATLKELFYWLEQYGIEFVSDRRPPLSWRAMKLKTYKNTVHILSPTNNKAVTIFTRVLSTPDNLRGMEFGWYWLDELRDTEEYAYNMILGRMRGYDYIRGLATTTTNGESWDYKLVNRNRNSPNKLYGSMHVQTIEAVKLGSITQDYYNMLLASYSPLMAEQELFAKHVNIGGGRAYYAASDLNKRSTAPWGDQYPSPHRPLVVGCDFNFSPAPCVWVVGQVGPGEWSEHIHWFREIAFTETSTQSMAISLISQFPGFFYEIYGDASGNRGTTSNAGQTDYDQIQMVLDENRCMFTIDVDQSNPRVKDRIENTNAKLKNALGQISMTYDPDQCPLLDGDFKMVGWKKLTREGGLGKLDDMGDKQRTHAGDAIGYAVFKKFPPGKVRTVISSLSSQARAEII